MHFFKLTRVLLDHISDRSPIPLIRLKQAWVSNTFKGYIPKPLVVVYRINKLSSSPPKYTINYFIYKVSLTYNLFNKFPS